MFQWYEGAVLCYVYLQGVCWTDERPDLERQFSSDVWWTRGWTLQELLASSNLVFYTKEWRSIGTKVNRVEEIHSRTGIGREYLLGKQTLSSASIATRMSWAAARVTERREDAAYCLLGIFDVHMPLLYGEGSRAFRRLQEEIMRFNDDQSLFAWCQPNSDSRWQYHGLLADSAAVFGQSGDIVPYSDWHQRLPSTVTSRGIHIQLGIKEQPGSEPHVPAEEILLGSLLCRRSGFNKGYVTISIVRLRGSYDRYARIKSNELINKNAYGGPQNVYILPDARAVREISFLTPESDQYMQLDLSERVRTGHPLELVKIFHTPNGDMQARFECSDHQSRGPGLEELTKPCSREPMTLALPR